MQITKNQLKTLRYIKKKKIVTYSQLNSKFNDLDWISPYVYITDHREDDADGFPIGDILPFETVKLNENGIIIVEENSWFTVQYALTNIGVPIFVGVLSSLITTLLLSLF